MSLRIDVDEAAWLRFLSRWALIPPLAMIGAMIAFQVAPGGPAFRPTAGPEADLHQDVYFNLVAAGRNPAVYRLGVALFALLFLGIGGTLLTLAGVLARRAPLRAAFLAACGVGQVAGVLGAFLRLGVTADLGARYAAATPDQRAPLLALFRAFNQADTVQTYVGLGLYAAGLLLVASGAFSLVGFPRWLAIWSALAGVLGLAFAAVFFAGGSLVPFFPGIVLQLAVGILGLHLAIAAAFWRRAPAPASGVPGQAPQVPEGSGA